jgi:uncharacterized protein (DUF2225 family)
MVKISRHALLVAVLVVCTSALYATTWVDQEVKCPICNTTNGVYAIASYGSYIYQWPSKYQYFFWPLTDNKVIYICKKCNYAAYMWDFDKVPDDQIESIRKALQLVKVSHDYSRYYEIPMSERLAVAEKVYSVQNRDDQFWCEFYRVKAYHLDAEGKNAVADEARKKALALAEKMLQNKENDGQRKELLLVSAAMHYFLGQQEESLAELKEAKELKYSKSGMKPEEIKNINDYLSDLINDYIKKAESHENLRANQQ